MANAEDFILKPEIQYLVSYSSGGYCLVAIDEDIEYIKNMKNGDLHTFKKSFNGTFLKDEIPENLTILDIVYDPDEDTYFVYLDHVIKGPDRLLHPELYTSDNPVLLNYIETYPKESHDRFISIFNEWKSLINEPQESPIQSYSVIVPIEISEQNPYTGSVTITLNYNI